MLTEVLGALEQGHLEVLYQGICLGPQDPVARVILVSRRPRWKPLTFDERGR